MWRQLRQLAASYIFSRAGMLRELIEHAADEVPERMAAERVAAEEHGVHGEHQRADADPERHLPGRIGEPHRLPDVVGQDEQKQDRQIQKVAVDVLEDERERLLAEILLARLADGARRRIGPERLVVGAAIVVAGEAETAGRPENQERGGKRQRRRPPAGLRAEPAVGAFTEEQRRIERRQIGPELVVLALETPPTSHRRRTRREP